MGRPSRMWLTWSTTPSSTRISASPSVLTTRERWGEGWGRQKSSLLWWPRRGFHSKLYSVLNSGDAHRWCFRNRWVSAVSVARLRLDLWPRWPSVWAAHSDAVQPGRLQHHFDTQRHGTCSSALVQTWFTAAPSINWIILTLSFPSSWTSGYLKTLAPPGGKFMTVSVWSDGEKLFFQLNSSRKTNYSETIIIFFGLVLIFYFFWIWVVIDYLFLTTVFGHFLFIFFLQMIFCWSNPILKNLLLFKVFCFTLSGQ